MNEPESQSSESLLANEAVKVIQQYLQTSPEYFLVCLFSSSPSYLSPVLV
jgi:hypothetical protein